MKLYLLLIISLISFSFQKNLMADQETDPSEENYNFNYGAILVTEEEIGVVKKLIGAEKLLQSVKIEAKEYKAMGEEFVAKYGETFSSLKKTDTAKMSSDINVLQGLLGTKFELLFQRSTASFSLYDEYEDEFVKFYTNAKDAEVGEWSKFEVVYNDTENTAQVNSLVSFVYRRSDDKYDVIFLSASQEFSIPPIKVLKPKEDKDEDKKEEGEEDDKGEEEEEEEEYELIYPTEYNEEQNNAIREWFKIVNLKGFLTIFGIEV